MSEFISLDPKGSATLETVVEAIVKLSAYDEAELLELVSAGKLHEAFPFRPDTSAKIPPDFASEEDLCEASALPLTLEDRKVLIQSSMPRAEASAKAGRLAAFLTGRDSKSSSER